MTTMPRPYNSTFTPIQYRKGTAWGKRPCFVCGHNTTKEPAAWTPFLVTREPNGTVSIIALRYRLCAKCRDWTPPTEPFRHPSAPAESMAAQLLYEVAPETMSRSHWAG